MCDRHLGIGADGIVAVDRLSDLSFEVTCYNADGSVATMCGNALRCAARSIRRERGMNSMLLRMHGRTHETRFDDDGRIGITVRHDEVPTAVEHIRAGGLQFEFHTMYTGTEHVVTFVDDVDSLDVVGIGTEVRHHSAYAPLGTNVNFAEVRTGEGLRVRTYERGVEDETLSCGSGAVACALVARHLGKVDDDEVAVHNRSKHPLTVHPENAGTGQAWLFGPAEVVYSGEFTWET